jgi:hypothetical protein
MSLHSMAFMAVAPFGSLLAGYLSKQFGAPNALRLCAFVCLLWAGYGMINLKKFVLSVSQMLRAHETQKPTKSGIAGLAPA